MSCLGPELSEKLVFNTPLVVQGDQENLNRADTCQKIISGLIKATFMWKDTEKIQEKCLQIVYDWIQAS